MKAVKRAGRFLNFYNTTESLGSFNNYVQVANTVTSYMYIYSRSESVARRGGAEVAGWTLVRKIRVRFPAYPHRVWAL